MRIFISLALLCATAVAAPAIEVIELRAQPALVRTVKAPPEQLGTAMAAAIMTLVGTADRYTLAIAGPPFARYVSRGEQYEVEVGLPIRKAPAKRKLGNDARVIELPAGAAATLLFRGPREDLPRAHAELDAWLAAHERSAAGPRWEVYLTNPIETPDPAAQQTRLVAPLATDRRD